MLKRNPMRLTIDDYAKRFDLPVAAIHEKLRAKELDYSIENGVVYILLPQAIQQKQKTSVGTIIALYQKENLQLKRRIEELESKIDRLIADKELMLREERDRIEHLYQSKDEQLRTVLELINTKLLLSQPYPVSAIDTTPPQNIDADLEEKDMTAEEESADTNKISLRKYLKNIGLNSEEKRLIKRRFATAYGSDIRVFQHNGEFYLDLSKFDYSDLLKI